MYAFFERLIKPFPAGYPKQPPANLFAFLLHYTRGCGPYLLIMAIASAIIAALEVVLVGFMGEMVDWLSIYTPDSFLAEKGDSLFWMGVVLVGVLPITVLVHSTVMHQTLLGNYPMTIRWLAHRYLLGQSYAFYQNEFAGRVATKVMQTALAVRETVMKVLDMMVYVGVYFTSVVVLVAVLDLRLAVPFVVWLALYFAILRYFLPRLEKISTRQADARSEMTGRIVDTYTNISTVKLFSHSQREADYAREGMGDFLQTVYPQMRMATSLGIALWILNIAVIFSVVSLCIVLWLQSEISVGAIAAAVALVLRVHGMSQWIMWEIYSLFENIGTARDGMNTVAQPQEIQDVGQAKPLRVEKGKINFRDVSFHYGKGSGVIEQLTLEIKPGEKVGFVGRSGAGKSTLVNLLLRFYDTEAGDIAIDDQNVSKVTQESLRAQIGVVTQDTSLLHRSVRDNLVYGRPDASEADMEEAARQAKAEEFIADLSDLKGRTGYDAHVGERGVKLSGGQRQRVAIARVLLKDAPILILDEATSALDSEVEAAIQENLNRLMEGKTVIAIAHRLSTIAALDRLIVLDEGRVIEEGSHQQLLAKKGLYAQLWARQSGGFLGEH
ncbi:ABC transporter ATP-binding protein [Teredinibacter franksiae]|uniref:ABC transporter ATP-binding protein n=1 Tax=Teredinibacter franksiae TaxID=2761453 RepID=UPI00162A984D|nr:ABC transporter ATP-binding protein [Teredinibacter franksiae]